MLDTLAQVIGMIAVCSVPMAIVLTRHQQKMAVILRNRQSDVSEEALQKAVQDLIYLTHQQSLSIQTLNETVKRLERQSLPPAGTDFENRLSNLS